MHLQKIVSLETRLRWSQMVIRRLQRTILSNGPHHVSLLLAQKVTRTQNEVTVKQYFISLIDCHPVVKWNAWCVMNASSMNWTFRDWDCFWFGTRIGSRGLGLGLDNQTYKKLLNQLHRAPVHENLKRSKGTSIGLYTQRDFTLVQKICNKKIIKTEVK